MKRMTAFNTSREIQATVEQVFAAFTDSQRLARWWGPAGFTNTFHLCEFKSGGRWSYIMHGPDGKNYPNESIFAEVESPRRVVIQHNSKPEYCLTITLGSTDRGTVINWSQEFMKSKVAEGIKHIVIPANEQNLDRLTAEVLRKS